MFAPCGAAAEAIYGKLGPGPRRGGAHHAAVGGDLVGASKYLYSEGLKGVGRYRQQSGDLYTAGY